jgi:dephospho-CoA kinase
VKKIIDRSIRKLEFPLEYEIYMGNLRNRAAQSCLFIRTATPVEMFLPSRELPGLFNKLSLKGLKRESVVMRIVALTGGVASGKSLVLHTFMKLGAYTIDCDVLSREVVIPCSKAWWEIVRFFGTDILRNDLAIDRKQLREIVFGDAQKRAALEKIIHPEVRTKCRERIEAIKTIEPDQKALVVVDVPLLIETGWQKDFDTVIVVYVGEEMQIKRLMKRDGITKDAAQELIALLQMPLKEKLQFANYVISNEGTREETEKKVRTIFAALSS